VLFAAPLPPEPVNPKPRASKKQPGTNLANSGRAERAKQAAAEAVKLHAPNLPPEDLYRILSTLVDSLKTVLKPVVSAPVPATPAETVVLPHISPIFASKESN
jgi:hypothetical protein